VKLWRQGRRMKTMRRYKLYYWLENYNSILPINLPTEDYITAITPLIDDFLKFNYGNRDMLYEFYEYLDGATDAQILTWIKQKIYLLFQAKNESYKRIYQGLTEEYNPLWNVDGKETVTHSGTDTDRHTGTDTETHSGSDSVDNTGTDLTTENHSGTDTRTTTNDGTDTNTETNSGTDATNNNVATFDDPNVRLNTSSQTLNGKRTVNELEHDTTTTEALKHGESVEGSITHELTTETEYGHVIARQNGHVISHENGHKIVTERQGNIGVTKSTELLRDHFELWHGLSFLDMVAQDIVQCICYNTI